jgi:hypothetical protein
MPIVTVTVTVAAEADEVALVATPGQWDLTSSAGVADVVDLLLPRFLLS